MSLFDFQKLRLALSAGFSRFPLVILAATAAAGCAIAANHINSASVDKELVRVVLAIELALPMLVGAAFAAELFARVKIVLQAVGLLWVVACWWLIGGIENWQVHTMLFIAGLSAASAVPGLAKSPPHNWWRVNVGTLNAIILAGLLALFVQIGLLLAIESVQSLFSLKLPKASQDSMAVCWLLLAPVAAAALLPPARAELDRTQPGFAAWGRLCQFAAIPLGFLFMAILTAYAVRIAVLQKLPDGMVALPVIALGCYSLAGRLLLEPWRTDKPWARAFALAFPAFPVFSILLFLALWVRIAEYGFTFERYAALALAVWLDLFCLLLLFRKNLSPAAAPALLAGFAFFALFSPLGARQVPLASQSARLEKLLAEPEPRSDESTRRLASAARYISLNYEPSVIEGLVGKLDLAKDAKAYEVFAAVREKLSLPEFTGSDGMVSKFSWPDEKPVPLAGAKNLFPGSGPSSYANLGNDPEGKILSVRLKDRQLVGMSGDHIDKTFDFGPLDALSPKAPAPPSFDWNIAGRAFRVVVVYARWETSAGASPELESVSFLVLEK